VLQDAAVATDNSIWRSAMLRLQAVREFVAIKLATTVGGSRVIEDRATEVVQARSLKQSTTDVRRLARLLDAIAAQLTESERDRFALQLMDATRSKDVKSYQIVLDWALTAAVRKRPQIVSQIAEYQRLHAAGELKEEGAVTEAAG
jgi:hypothetical protein